MIDKVPSGSIVIDKLLAGGFERGIISTVYGQAGSGKSNITMLAAMKIATTGKKVVFVDTEGSFSTERFAQLDEKNNAQLLKNVLILNPATFDEQKKVFTKLRDTVNAEKVGIIIVDSIAMLYRLQKGSEETIQTTNKEMANQLAILSEIARKKNIPVVVTNQVYADFENKSDVRMVGGDLLKYWSKCIVKLEITDSGQRKASIYKHRSLPSGNPVFFEIINNGLKEVPEQKKKFSLF